MKSLRFVLSVVLMSLSTVAFAQHDAQKSSVAPVPSEAQKSFTTMKTLAGEWEGPVTVPEMPEMSGGKPMHASLRVTSRGNALVHEFQEAGTPLDATKYDHPVTVEFSLGGIRYRICRVPEHQRLKKHGQGYTAQPMRVHLQRRDGGNWASRAANKAE